MFAVNNIQGRSYISSCIHDEKCVLVRFIHLIQGTKKYEQID